MSAITLTHPTAGASSTPLQIELPSNLLWVDEYSWNKIVSAKGYTGEGALVVDEWVKQTGRPITLQGEQNRAWCERGLLETLRTWSWQTGLVLTLTHRGTAYQARFDSEQGSPIQADPLTDLLGSPGQYQVRNDLGQITVDVEVDYFNPRATDPFTVTLRFHEL